MYENKKADTRPAYSSNISHNIKNTVKNQAVIPFNPAKITEILRDKLNIEVSSPKIRTEKFERPKENPSVYYKVFDNGNGNYIFHGGDFATGEQFTEYLNEKGDIRGKTNEDNKTIKQATRKAEEERDKYYEETARRNAYILQKSNKPIPDDFAYCLKKDLTGSDFKAFQSIGYNPKYKNIVMPLFDIFDKHWANQYIYPDKITLPNGEKTDKIIKGKMGGCFNVAGDIENSDIVYFAEGAVTALIVHLATGKPCVFGVNAGNIEPVFLALKGKYSDKEVVLIADNDIEKEAEKGINKGRETAEKLNSKYSLPYILSPVNSDFNDYYKSFIDEDHTREQALNKVKEYILNPDNIVEANKEEDSETPEQRIERLRNVYPFTTPPLEALPVIKNEGEEIKISEIIQDLADCIGCSANSMIGAALITPLICAGHFINTKLSDTHIQKTRCNFCDVSLPSTGKTHGQEEIAVNLIKEAYKEEYEQYKTLLAEYKKKEAEFEAKLKKDEKLTPTEEDYLRHGEPINPGKALITGGTIQGYGKPDTAPPHGVKLLYLDECQSLAKDVLSDRSDTDAGGMTKLMDGSFHCANHATKDDGFSEIQVLMLGNTQPDNFEKYFKPILKSIDGFGIRILYTIDRCGKPCEPKNLFRAWKSKYKKAWHN